MFANREVVTSIAIKTNNSIQLYSFICIQSNGFKYFFVIPIIQFRGSLLFNTKNAIQHYPLFE